jgi:O-antigen/teichoic acid export membrane protein
VIERPKTDALRIAKNAMSGAGARIAMMLIGFGLTPFIIHALGLQQFGMWAVVGAIAGYLGLLDFGLGGVFVKFLSEYIEQAQPARARQVLTFGMIFYALFGAVLAVPIAFAAPHIVRLFKMPADQYAGAAHVFYALFGLLVLTMVLGLPGAALVAMQRLDLVSRNNFIGYLAYAAGTVLLVRLGYGIWGVIGGQAIQIAVSCGLHWLTARRIFGPMLHHPLKIERAIVRRMLAFGGWTQMTAILNIVSLDVGRFISAGLISVASVSYYELGSKIAFFSRSMPSYLLDAIFPSAAAAAARGDNAAIEQLYESGTVYGMFLTLGIAGFCIGAAGPVLHVWLGHEYPYVAAILLWLGLGYAISGMTGTGTTIVRASGLPNVETYFTAVTATVNLAASAVLATRFGIIGVAAGSAAGWTAGTVYFLIRFHAIRHTSWWKTVGTRIVRLALACGVASGFVAFASAQPEVSGLFANRVTGIAALVALGVAYSLTYVALTVVLRTWEAQDRRLLRRATRGGLDRTGRLLGFARGNAA